MTTAEFADGKAYFYYDFPNDQDPHLYIDEDITAGVTATGMHERLGAFLIEVPAKSQLADYGFKGGDVVLMVDQRLTPSIKDFSGVMNKLKAGRHTVKVWRAQEWNIITFNK